MSLTRSLITQQHRPILDQLLVRLSLRQGHATYTMVFWIPSLIKSWGVADLFHVGLLATWPQIAGIIGTILMGRHSDKKSRDGTTPPAWPSQQSAFWPYIFPVLASIIGLTLAGLGFISATPLFFTTTTEYLSKASAAGGIALISSLGNLGPAVAPSVTGYITRQQAARSTAHILSWQPICSLACCS